MKVLSASKTAVLQQYHGNDRMTYVISILNSGAVAFTGLTLVDNLGAYSFGTGSLTPLTYVDGSVRYYVNGTLQPALTAAGGPPLTISGINVPANGNVIIVYQAEVNQYAPLPVGSTIVNGAEISGGGLSTPITVTETITAADESLLTISKGICPTTVTENGQIPYTFTIQNSGNTPATQNDNVILTDTFNPVLNNISVTFNGAAWTSQNYTYDEATGVFRTLPAQLTVPAATYTQNPDIGVWTVTPGVSTLVVTGIV